MKKNIKIIFLIFSFQISAQISSDIRALNFTNTPAIIVKETSTSISLEVEFNESKYLVKSNQEREEGSFYINGSINIHKFKEGKWGEINIHETHEIVEDIEIYNTKKSLFIYYEDYMIGATAGPMAGYGFIYSFNLLDISSGKIYSLEYKGCGACCVEELVCGGEFIIDELIQHPEILKFLQVKSIYSKHIHKSEIDKMTSLKLGDPDIIYSIGKLYVEGRYVPRDLEIAYDWFKRSAEQNNADAQFKLGYMNEKGIGTRKNEYSALSWYSKSARNGNSEAQYALGLIYYNGKSVPTDMKKAFKLFESSANSGNRDGLYALGLMYEYGDGVLTDKKEAFRLYTRAANKYHKNAEYNLGLMYYNGDVVPKNYSKAMQLFEYSGESGNCDAQYNLGIMYLHGEGVKVDKKKAAFWIKKSYENGCEDAKIIWDDLKLWNY